MIMIAIIGFIMFMKGVKYLWNKNNRSRSNAVKITAIVTVLMLFLSVLIGNFFWGLVIILDMIASVACLFIMVLRQAY